MDTIKCITTRRSVRKYKEKKVPDKIVEKLLTCAMQAPSGVNEQCWEFIVVRDKELLAKIPKINYYSGMAKKAPLAIITCINLKKESTWFRGLGIQDVSASTENLLLSAHALGLGAVWTAIHPNEGKVKKTREIFNLPDYVIPLAIIPIGYPNEKIKPVNRFVKSKVHYEKW
jgi:nitroreductase